MAAETSSTSRRPRPVADGLGLSTSSPTVRRASTPQTWATASTTTDSPAPVKFSLASVQSEQALSSAPRVAQPPPTLSRAAPTFTPAASSSSPLSNSPRSHIITPVRLPSRQSTTTSTSRTSGGGGGGGRNSGGGGGGGKKKSTRGGGSSRGGRGGITTLPTVVQSSISTPLNADAVVFVGATPNRGGGNSRGGGRNRGGTRGGKAVAS